MQGDLVVVSHLRWDWVWQRPQHLISRLAKGRTTWFVEEPHPADVTEPRFVTEDAGPVRRLWLETPDPGRHMTFEGEWANAYTAAIADIVGPSEERTAWIYTPLALGIALATSPTVLVYDVMDDLAAFKDASPALRLQQARALRVADVVFAGGRSLHRSVFQRRPEGTYLFPSGVEPAHYAEARVWRHRARPRPVAGYVGVIDERVDLGLVAELAERLPDWEIQLVGPLAKIAPDDLPHAPNLRYLGAQPYARLPELMGGFDVALMPFALNEATRSISPTKTLEYLAAGLPVVSTRVPDVVASYPGVVDLQDDAAGFADACQRVLRHDLTTRDDKVRPLLAEHHWDTIADRMAATITAARTGAVDHEEEATL